MHSSSLYLDTVSPSPFFSQKQQAQRIPIWMMRQAGRYLPEYRAIREKHSFLEMVYTPDLATEITLQPIRRFGFDVAILFSDILVTAQALGASLEFIEKKGPVFDRPIQTDEDVDALDGKNALAILAPIFQTIRQLKPSLEALHTPLLGFAGAPFTVAAYMIEGSSSSDLKKMKRCIHSSPDRVHAVLKKLTDVTIVYLQNQIDAGVDAIQLFDTWAIHLDWQDFSTISLPYIRLIVEAIRSYKPSIPITLFCKGSGGFATLLMSCKPDVIGLDWNCNLIDMRSRLGNTVALQGNLDPYALYATPEILKHKVQYVLDQMKVDARYVFNLGHGLMPDIDPDQVKRVVEWVKGAAI